MIATLLGDQEKLMDFTIMYLQPHNLSPCLKSKYSMTILVDWYSDNLVMYLLFEFARESDLKIYRRYQKKVLDIFKIIKIRKIYSEDSMH